MTSQIKACIVYPEMDDYKPQFYSTRTFPHMRVGDALRDQIDEWIPQNPVLIDAGVGTGKTTFVYQDLLPRALEAGKNLLLISNRVALSLQQKQYLMDILEDPRRELLTTKGIQAEEDFGQVKVITYHRLQHLLNDPDNERWLQNLLYVVADEAHFFSADSFFNTYCSHILSQLTTKFRHAIRIYMTATPWDTMCFLAEAEQNALNKDVRRNAELIGLIPSSPPFPYQYPDPPKFLHYVFARDYSAYKLNFFDSFTLMADKINLMEKEKFLVFIDNKPKADKFMALLEGKAAYLDSTQKGSDLWNRILQDEKFSEQVLVCTSVLDCGVNLKDPDLKHIVILADNRTSIMQMVGRKRCSPGEQVNIWIHDLSAPMINYRCTHYLTLLQLQAELRCAGTDEKRLNQFLSKIWLSDDRMLRYLFTPSIGKIWTNEYAFFVLRRRKYFIDRLKSGETTFRYEVEEWFGKEHPPVRNELDAFYESYGERELNSALQDQLRKIIMYLFRQSGRTEAQPSRMDKLKHQALNNRLRELCAPYIIACHREDWILHYSPNAQEGNDEA